MGWFTPSAVYRINREWVLDPICPLTRVTVIDETTGKTASRVSSNPVAAETECKRLLKKNTSFLAKLFWH